MQSRTFIISDIHGCHDEFKELLKLIDYKAKNTRVVCVSDFLDRGPDPIACIRIAQESKFECVLANHEDKAWRWRKHEAKFKSLGIKNPMKAPNDKTKGEWEALSEKDLKWIEDMPTSIHLKDNWHVIHGGCESNKSFKDQDKEQIIRCRFLNEKGRAVALNRDRTQPDKTKYWTEMWDGPESIIFGHCVFKEPRVDERPNGVFCVGIDTGCVYGGALTAFHLEKFEFIQVKAKKVYHKK